MGTLKIPVPFKAKNDILRTLLHKGSPNEVLTLRLWGPTGNAVGGREAKASITSGWNHKQEKDVETNQVIEVLKINLSDTVTEALLRTCSGCDIVFENNSFDRYSFQGKSQLKHMTGEWQINVTPSFQDKTPLYVAPLP